MSKTSKQISEEIFYKPATNGKAENSIQEGSELINNYAKEKVNEALDLPKNRKNWYDEKELKRWLVKNKYSEDIALELAPMLVKNYNSAFKKGYQMGRDDAKNQS